MSSKARFENYYNEYQDMVFALCLGYSKGDHDLANDLVQEVFIKIWGALHKFEGRSSPKTWIYRITVNTCLLQIRRNKNKYTESLSGNHAAIAEESSPDRKFHELYKAIGQLTEVDRIIIMLVLDNIAYKEISEITGISEGTIRVRISRAKQKLNKLISNDGR